MGLRGCGRRNLWLKTGCRLGVCSTTGCALGWAAVHSGMGAVMRDLRGGVGPSRGRLVGSGPRGRSGVIPALECWVEPALAVGRPRGRHGGRGGVRPWPMRLMVGWCVAEGRRGHLVHAVVLGGCGGFACTRSVAHLATAPITKPPACAVPIRPCAGWVEGSVTSHTAHADMSGVGLSEAGPHHAWQPTT
jgi:hypothetical protein